MIKGWYVVIINALVAITVLTVYPQFSMTVLKLSEELGISASLLMTSDTIKCIGVVLAGIISGFLYRKIGGQKTIFLALTCIILPQFLLPFITNFTLFCAVKFMQGIGSIFFPVFIIYIYNWTTEKYTGIATAVFIGVMGSGVGLGAFSMGLIIEYYGFKASFFALGAVQAIFAALWFLTVREKPSTSLRNYHVDGDEIKAETLENTQEGRKKLEFKHLLKMPALWALAFCTFACTWISQAVSVDMPLFAVDIGYSEFTVGSLLTATTFASMPASFLSGVLSDFFAAKCKKRAFARANVLIFGVVIMMIGMTFMVLTDVKEFRNLYVVIFLLEFGACWGTGAYYSIIPELFSEKDTPIATGIANGISDSSIPLAPFVVGVVFGLQGHWDTGWMTCLFAAALSLAAASMLCIVARGIYRAKMREAA